MTPRACKASPRNRRAVISTALLTIVVAAVLVYAPTASADLARSGSSVLVSTFADGRPADGGEPSVSADGRYVAFASWDKLVPEARDNCQSVYRKDMGTGELLLLTPDICSSFLPSISADGNKVLYVRGFCRRDSMFLNNYCSGSRAYVRDIAAGTTITISDTKRSAEYAKLSSDGNYAVLLHSDGWDVWGAQVRDVRDPSTVWHIGSIGLSVPDFTADISGDGRYVVFESEEKHVAQDTDRSPDVYLFDRMTGAKTLVGIHPSGQARFARHPSISADGSTIAFVSTDSHGVDEAVGTGYLWLASNVYARHLPTGTTTLVSQNSAGAPSWRAGTLWTSVSGDGNLITFDSFVPLGIDANPDKDIYLRNISAGKTSLVSILPDGTQGYGFRQLSDIADSGRFVAFESSLDPELPYERRVYLRNLQTPCGLAVCPLDYP